MARKIVYWATTGLLAVMSAFAAFAYLSGSKEAVEGFAAVGYPQQLRVILGIAKAVGVIVLVVPGLRLAKEWAYAGFAFAWIAATVAHTLAHDGHGYMPPILIVLLIVSYLTRPDSRRLKVSPATAA